MQHPKNKYAKDVGAMRTDQSSHAYGDLALNRAPYLVNRNGIGIINTVTIAKRNPAQFTPIALYICSPKSGKTPAIMHLTNVLQAIPEAAYLL